MILDKADGKVVELSVGTAVPCRSSRTLSRIFVRPPPSVPPHSTDNGPRGRNHDEEDEQGTAGGASHIQPHGLPRRFGVFSASIGMALSSPTSE